MVYLSCMTNTTQSFDPAPFVCVNCRHEHHYEDTTVRDHDGSILCEDVAACEARGFVVDEPEDPGIDAPPAHLDGNPNEGQPGDDFYGDDAAFDEYRMDQGWDDYDDGSYEKEYD